VEDLFDSKGRLRCSWDNRCRYGIRVLARLNRLYALKGT
jgi:hypothetical protein